MAALLLTVLYIAFVGLGLPNSLLGAAWPVIGPQMNAPISYAGALSMIMASGTIVASLYSARLTRRLGAGPVAAASVLIAAVALFGFSTSRTFWMLCVWAIPYGLGSGAVDAALNNYVALHYASRHMSWLHCFWGVGATVSPYLMSVFLENGLGWRMGYRAAAIAMAALTAILLVSLPLWGRQKHIPAAKRDAAPPSALPQILRVKGAQYALIALFGYSALECTVGLWASSFLVLGRGIGSETAAKYTSLFYLGITLGRLLSGFVANRIGDRNMVRAGIAITLIGIIAIGLPIEANGGSLYGLIIVGLGCAPIYPSIIHATPDHFGAERSQAMVGVQMASAYTGATLIPPLFGWIAGRSVRSYPVFLLIFALLMLVMTEKLNRTVSADSARRAG